MNKEAAPEITLDALPFYCMEWLNCGEACALIRGGTGRSAIRTTIRKDCDDAENAAAESGGALGRAKQRRAICPRIYRARFMIRSTGRALRARLFRR